MTQTPTRPAAGTELPETAPDRDPDRPRALRRFGPAIGLAVLVALLAQLPLLHNPAIYFWDDSAAQFIPTWRYLGEQLRAGNFPLLLPEFWAGGNLAAEALFGLWNPVCLVVAVIVSLIPNLAIAATVVKTTFLVVLALGGYGVAREYGAGRGAAVAAGAALPFAGFTLYFDAGSWASGLIATSMVPHLWWTARRAARGELNPLVPFAVGFLTITTGNPYGVLGACLVFGALLVEFGLLRNRGAIRSVLLTGVATGLCVPLVFLPLLLNAAVTVRAGTSLRNDGFMVPGLADVLNLSTPSFLPYFWAHEKPYLTVPVTYLAWWILPLLPWLRWRVLAERIRSLTGLLVFGGVALLMSVAPSDVWMFRWPARLLPFFALAVAVLAAVGLTGGLRTDHRARRAGISAAIIAVGGYLSLAARPELKTVNLAGLALVALLTVGAVVLARSRPRLLGPALAASGAVVLLVQTTWFPANQNVTQYNFPTSVDRLRADFADRYPGTTLQVANGVQVVNQRTPQTSWHNLLFGSMLHTAGVDAVNTYTGMNYRPFAEALCLNYEGSVCPDALNRLWRPRTDGRPPLADLLRLETVVVQNNLAGLPAFQVPAGWRVAERTDVVTVYRRTDELPYSGSRLAAVSRGTTAAPVSSGPTAETVRVSGPGVLTFARLDWPGYRASLDGADLPVGRTADGLVTVTVPDGRAGDLVLRWSAPGLPAGVAAVVVAALLAVGHAVIAGRSRRRYAENTVQRVRPE